MADIFISYSNTDRDRVIPIVKALEKQGWSVFWDWRSIPVAEDLAPIHQGRVGRGQVCIGVMVGEINQ